MRRRQGLAAALALLGLPGAGRAAGADEGFELITPGEAAREQQALAASGDAQAGGVAHRRTRALTPAIRVAAPRLGAGAMKSPLRIELEFLPAGEARIDPKSFRVLYGMFRIDLTDKIRENAVVSERGLVAERAKIPAGEHRLFLQIADELERRTETELRLIVED